MYTFQVVAVSDNIHTLTGPSMKASSRDGMSLFQNRYVANTLSATDRGNDRLVDYFLECIRKVTREITLSAL